MKRILGAVAVIIALAAIIFVWQPWESRRTVLPPSSQQQQPEPTTPLVSIAEMQARMADDESVKNTVARALNALASSEKEPDFLDKDCEADAQAKDIYRGMMLSFAGYLLVMTDLRSGDYENYGFVPEDHSQIDPQEALVDRRTSGSGQYVVEGIDVEIVVIRRGALHQHIDGPERFQLIEERGNSASILRRERA
jgi:hypothetical protein